MVIIEPAVASAWLLGLGSKLSWQHAAHAQQRSYSIHAVFPSRKRKKGFADRVISVESCQSLSHFFFNFRSQRLITIVPGKKIIKKELRNRKTQRGPYNTG